MMPMVRGDSAKSEVTQEPYYSPKIPELIHCFTVVLHIKTLDGCYVIYTILYALHPHIMVYVANF